MPRSREMRFGLLRSHIDNPKSTLQRSDATSDAQNSVQNGVNKDSITPSTLTTTEQAAEEDAIVENVQDDHKKVNGQGEKVKPFKQPRT